MPPENMHSTVIYLLALVMAERIAELGAERAAEQARYDREFWELVGHAPTA